MFEEHLKEMTHILSSIRLPIFAAAIGGILLIVLLSGAQPLPEPPVPEMGCPSAEECFNNAILLVDRTPQDFAVHRTNFQQVQRQYPQSVWGKRAGLRLGYLLLEVNPQEAIPYLREAERNFPLLQDYIRVWMAQALRETDSSQEAAATFESVLEKDPESLLKTSVFYGGGLAWQKAGHCHHAVPHLQRALSLGPDSDDAPQALQAIADCGRKLENSTLVIDSLRELWVRYPLSPEAKTIQELLEKNDGLEGSWEPSLGDYFQRAETYYGQAQFELAIGDLKRFLKGRPARPGREKGQWKLAMAHVRLKQYPKASQLFAKLSEGQSSYRGQATEWLARVYLRQGKGGELIALSQLPLSGLKSNERSQIQWMCGIWYEDQGDIERAVQAYQRAADLAGSSRTRFEAWWRQGWLLYQHGQFQPALQVFERILQNSNDQRWAAKAQYWAGRTLANLGLNDQAQEYYRRVSQEWPMTYYGQLAQSRLASLPITSVVGESSLDPGPEVSENTRQLLEKDRHFQKAQELALLGLMSEAASELLHVGKSYQSREDALYEIAIQLEKVRAYDQSLLIARRHFNVSVEQRRFSRSSGIWSVAYPGGYLPTIQRFADSRVDPYLIAGIIREESLYNTQALSPVGAIGLMQLMPTTAERVARKVGFSSFKREDLFSGEINIQLGVQYVSQLLGEYEGKNIPVIAAYNAGPNAVKRWLDKNGHREADEFVELISYKETRRYVKRVLTSYHVYRDLYSTRCSGSSLDKVC
ncbi:transglycosylase SLT domain-containing protein [Candidatus Nitronereus thalassa]|uniref:Transglycosylase SLT domain-containing protein n=1 Tax=Candidatus Nitronereus thalassa TaxID=3020898 RepID=A0ABU3KAB2_9BACT|nr:transglycosylase SLT domain-containing protein [Candidatus Nitronereus thalassa]MDT7043324.1 transglycosylase SLT domain-containing protein [Candidatus Nitronereus thalassa]